MPGNSGKGPGLLIVGLGGQAHVAASIARALGITVWGHLDGFAEPTSSEVGGLRVVGGLAMLRGLEVPAVTIAIGDNRQRFEVAGFVRAVNVDCSLVSLIHPRSFVEQGVVLGPSVTICVGAIVCAEATIGEGALVNSGAIVEHECVLGRYSHVCPGVRMGGRTEIGEFTQVGVGSTILDKIRIGRHAVIGGGAVVIDDIPDYATAVGVPARVIKRGQPPS